LRQVPNVLQTLLMIPAFAPDCGWVTPVSSTDQAPGWNAGVEDVFVGRTGLTLSGDYQAT